MKTFDQLTLEQRLDAYQQAKQKLAAGLADGSLELEHERSITLGDLVEMAEEIAENAKYTDDGKPYVDEVEVPYYFLGGCV